MSMRILFIHEVNYKTKPIFEMHEFPEYMSARGHTVGFLHFPEGAVDIESEAKTPNPEKFSRLQGQEHISLFTPKLFFRVNTMMRLEAAIRGFQIVWSTIRNFSPDVVVLYAIPTFGWQTAILGKLLGIPVIYRAIDVSHLIRPGWHAQLVWVAERVVQRLAHAVMANSPAMADYARKAGASSVVVCPPLITAKYWKMSEAPKERIVLFVGTFFKFAGLEALVQEFGRQASPEDKLVLVGGGPEYETVQRIIEASGLGDRVSLVGWVDFGDLGLYLSKASVGVNPMIKSKVADYALPNKVLQYLVAGLPAVSTRLKGLESYFKDGDNCSLHFANSTAELVSTALKILNESSKEPLCKELLQFSPESAIARFEEILRLEK